MLKKSYKNVSGGYIASITTGAGQIEISQAEYNEIIDIIRAAPTPPEGYVYKLRDADLTWELVELPPEPYEPTDEDKAEAYDILMGEAT